MAGNPCSVNVPVEVVLTYEQLQITIDDFAEFTGHSLENNKVILADLEDVIYTGGQLIKIQCLYTTFNEISLSTTGFEVQNVTFYCNRKIAVQLKGSEMMIVFVCTAGPGVHEQYKEYISQNELVKAYFIDLLGNIAVEKAMDIIQLQLLNYMDLYQMKSTNRYSPGYCGWDITEQSKLFSLLPVNPCGIKLSESSLMVPSKSISGVIGCGATAKYNEYGCQLCEMKKCLYRKLKNQKQQK